MPISSSRWLNLQLPPNPPNPRRSLRRSRPRRVEVPLSLVATTTVVLDAQGIRVGEERHYPYGEER